jgi:hypothetical protein
MPTGATINLSLTNIPERAGQTLQGTLEAAELRPETKPFLEHNAIPLTISEEDIDQAAAANLVTKVVYLMAADSPFGAAEVNTLVSTRLDSGADPVAEAQRRGHILATLRLGNRVADDEAVPRARQRR